MSYPVDVEKMKFLCDPEEYITISIEYYEEEFEAAQKLYELIIGPGDSAGYLESSLNHNIVTLKCKSCSASEMFIQQAEGVKANIYDKKFNKRFSLINHREQENLKKFRIEKEITFTIRYTEEFRIAEELYKLLNTPEYQECITSLNINGKEVTLKFTDLSLYTTLMSLCQIAKMHVYDERFK